MVIGYPVSSRAVAVFNFVDVELEANFDDINRKRTY